MGPEGNLPGEACGESVAVVIPARYASTRLEAKLLAVVAGKPLIEHTWRRASESRLAHSWVIATDDRRILEAARAFGATAWMTRADHASGTDRIAELVLAGKVDADIIVNVQGDEPEIDPSHIDLAAKLLVEDPRPHIATLVTPVGSLEEYADPNAVKAVLAADGRALYFSRAKVPFVRDGVAQGADFAALGIYRHIGLYAYRREALVELSSAAPSRLEKLERLEQLRALEMGMVIKAGIVGSGSLGIDTAEDLEAFRNRVESGASGGAAGGGGSETPS